MFAIILNDGQGVVGPFSSEKAAEQYLLKDGWVGDYYKQNPGLWAKHIKGGPVPMVARIKPLASPG